MSTEAQFHEGQVVWYTDWYTDGNLDKKLAVITKVVEKNPAQYDVAKDGDSSKTVCGEGIDEAVSVQALS